MISKKYYHCSVKRKIELLAPGGDVDSIKSAIIAGADAIYCGLDKFNARNRATNISFVELQGILRLAHKNNCKVFLTLNIIIVDTEVTALIGLLNKLVNTSIDGVIVQDFGMFYLLSKYFKGLEIHASTQLTTHNEGQIQFLSQLGAERVNLSRELNIHEIKALSSFANKNKVLTEVFVHGSYCISFSGICYMSSVKSGKSGNRGRCSQPCRERYITTAAGKNFPLNLKDNSAYFDLIELSEAGVASLKIEGRIKEFEYVYTVVNSWNKQLQYYYNHNKLLTDNSDLYTVFNRDFSNGFLKGEISSDMFIDDPMTYSTKRLSDLNKQSSKEELLQYQKELFKNKDEIRESIRSRIDELKISKIPLSISISGECGSPLRISIITPDTIFKLFSEVKLEDKGLEALTHKIVLNRLKVINETEYFIEHLDLSEIKENVYIPFKELTSIKKRLLFILNNSHEIIPPIEIPSLKKNITDTLNPTLSILISSFKDLEFCKQTSADIYFQLPNSLGNDFDELIDFFTDHKEITPWFPSVLIGDDYTNAIAFLDQLPNRRIVTNNTGIAYEAFKKKISWIAGPFLNITNSFSLINLKENFNCEGAFISNELSRRQIKSIKKPKDFKLYYSIYHPIVLMTSRQCFFHQVTGCEKSKIDEVCLSNCEKTSSITNLNDATFAIEKKKGDYNSIYNDENFLNTEILKDIPNTFNGFLIDLRDIKSDTKTDLDKSEMIKLFEKHLDGNSASIIELKQKIYPSTNTQYKKGI